jgi:cell wall-associated NlpC family hydrolase
MLGCAPKRIRVYESLTEIRGNLIQSAMDLVGKPYRNGAKGPDAFDCSGFVHHVYKRSGVVLPVSTEPLLRSGYETSRETVLPGDLVFFKIKRELHVGILLSKNQFVHSSKSRGVAVDDLNAAYWKRSLLCFRCII